jgi:hypothetical protein
MMGSSFMVGGVREMERKSNTPLSTPEKIDDKVGSESMDVEFCDAEVGLCVKGEKIDAKVGSESMDVEFCDAEVGLCVKGEKIDGKVGSESMDVEFCDAEVGLCVKGVFSIDRFWRKRKKSSSLSCWEGFSVLNHSLVV